MSRDFAPAPARRRLNTGARLVMVLMVAALLAGCGKKGNPEPPAGQPNTYPRVYPSS